MTIPIPTDLPIATVTVRFRTGVTARQLTALVWQVVRQGGEHVEFIVDRRYYDGDDLLSVGQTGNFFRDQIRVVPALELPFFQSGDPYTKALVTSHTWVGEDDKRRFNANDRQMIIGAVRKFARELTDAYQTALHEGFPEYVEPE